MLIATKKSEQNQGAIDPWTVVHFSMGLAAGLMKLPFVPVMTAAVAYELIEHTFEDSEYGKEFFDISGPENGANVVVDLAVFVLGYWLADRWNRS